MNDEPNALAAATTTTTAGPHPVDRALAALSDLAADLLAGGRPQRFTELQRIAGIAQQVQLLRPNIGVDDLVDDAIDGPPIGFGANPVVAHRNQRFNDGADLNRELLMMGQGFLEKYLETEKAKLESRPDDRLRAANELDVLVSIRTQVKVAGEAVPAEIDARIEQLLKKIGAPSHERGRDTLVHPEPVRGHQADGDGQQDRGGVGATVAERAGGDGRTGQ